ncbi:hypothetical protein [Kribbella catacumbae]|uniref:hypothetical protein n=1 Tax=Kribbella catacumbae TaxID=460086 RepID=UPI000369C080|nr:hypothetical protein [Kribbella catacumbae]
MATIGGHRASTAAESPALRMGSALMAVAGLASIGYAVIFFVRNFTGLIYLATAILVVGAALALKPLLTKRGGEGA